MKNMNFGFQSYEENVRYSNHAGYNQSFNKNTSNKDNSRQKLQQRYPIQSIKNEEEPAVLKNYGYTNHDIGSRSHIKDMKTRNINQSRNFHDRIMKNNNLQNSYNTVNIFENNYSKGNLESSKNHGKA